MDSIKYFYTSSQIHLCIDIQQSEYSLEQGVATNFTYFDVLQESELMKKDDIRHGEGTVLYTLNKPH